MFLSAKIPVTSATVARVASPVSFAASSALLSLLAMLFSLAPLGRSAVAGERNSASPAEVMPAIDGESASSEPATDIDADAVSGKKSPSEDEDFSGGDVFVRGDCNADGRVNIADVQYLLRYLYAGDSPPPCITAADANDDERIDHSDAVKLAGALFGGGSPLSPPGPEPGPDPTPGPGCDGSKTARSDRGGEAETTGEEEGEAAEEEEASYLRLEVVMRRSEIEVTDAKVLDGPLVLSEVVTGEYVYEVTAPDGTTLAVESFQDPRSRRCSHAEGEEGEDRSPRTEEPEGTFVVRVPNREFTDEVLAGAKIKVFRRTEEGAGLRSVHAKSLKALQGREVEIEFESSPGEILRVAKPALERFRELGPMPVPGDAGVPVGGGGAVTSGPTVTPLLINGPTGMKFNVAIVGDGFSASEQETYNDVVDKFVIQGAFGHDIFNECANALNIYRINVVSAESGVTRATHCQFLSNWVNAAPDADVLGTGTIRVGLPGGVQFDIWLSVSNRSFRDLEAGFLNIPIPGDICGPTKALIFEVRLDTEDPDGDGAPDRCRIWIGAPRDLPGPDGNFTITPNLQGGAALTFTQTAVGTRTDRNTALGYIYNGVRHYFWLQEGCVTSIQQSIILSLVPEWHFVIVILNESGFGGCGGGGYQAITSGVSWQVLSHEMGHGIGGLGDEYTSPGGTYTGSRPGYPNLDTTTDRNTIKWKDLIDPSTPLPTKQSDVTDGNQDVGAFLGGHYCTSGIYRPVYNCRMNGNTPDFCPVCYRHIRELLYQRQELTFDRCSVGDFDGDGRDDLVQHSARMLALFLSDGSKLKPTSFATEHLPTGGWYIRSRDQHFVGDFDGDGRDDLFVFNGSDWSSEHFALLRSTGSGFEMSKRFVGSIPGWGALAPRDKFLVADFDGDGKSDIFIFNGYDWGDTCYFGMYRSTGSSLDSVRRYTNSLPLWGAMGSGDHFSVGDFDGDGKDDLYIFNGVDWTKAYLGMLRSTGTELAGVRRHVGSLPLWGTMKSGDRFFAGDFDGDGKDDLYIFNGTDWSKAYLGMFRSTGTDLARVQYYAGSVPGWGTMKRGDQYYVADINGDGREDLYGYNATDWPTEFLGRLISNGSALSGGYCKDWIGDWNLGQVDRFLVADFDGDSKDDLFVRNSNWFGMLWSQWNTLNFKRLYLRYIHNFRYNSTLGHSE
jgi:hypothetical protein